MIAGQPDRADPWPHAMPARAGEALLAQANRLLAEHRYGTPEHEQGYALLRAAAEAPDGARAQWMLGAYHLQVVQRPGASAEALAWLRRAAAAGMAPALDRLADALLQDIATPFAIADALPPLRLLADHGHPPSAWQLAYLAGQGEAPDLDVAPASLWLRACALGFGPAYYGLGLRVATGDGVPRDATLGRALLLRAADAGLRDAREAADELAADADPAATATLHAALKANLAAAQPLLAAVGRDEIVPAQGVDPCVRQIEAHLASVGHPAFFVDPDGRAAMREAIRPAATAMPRWQWSEGRPRVGTADDFATREECAWLVHKVADSLLRPDQSGRRHSANDASEIEQFDGQVRPLRPLETDAVVRMLQHRAVRTLGWRARDLEPSSVIRYVPGNAYDAHVDYFTDEQIALNRAHAGDGGGQRVATFLVYLQAPLRGGETDYPRAGLRVRGRRGLAVAHYNVADGRPDPESLHAGLPVVEGEKWLWRSTLREHALYA